MSPAPIFCDCLTWASRIGLFLLNFGTLDYLVFVFLKDRLSPDDFASIRERPFKERINRIARQLSDQAFPAEEQAAFARLIEQLEPIRELRNHIAHGHMHARCDDETKAVTITLIRARDADRSHLPESQHLEFAEMVAAERKLFALSREFERLVGFRASITKSPPGAPSPMTLLDECPHSASLSEMGCEGPEVEARGLLLLMKSNPARD